MHSGIMALMLHHETRHNHVHGRIIVHSVRVLLGGKAAVFWSCL